MTLKRIDNGLDEDLFIGRASSGLRFVLNPKRDFSKTMGVMGVRFGSTDDRFRVNGGDVSVPEGTAHFLEHKLFENQDGDVSDRFSMNGAHCNAATGFSTTSYLFTCTENVVANLGLLLDFVQNPYFTAELIAKEQGIIGQEIKMYEDDPEWVVFFNLMKILYREHPVRQNIAGTVESISTIDVDVLKRCYEGFYRPGNMMLVLSGRMDAEGVAELIERDAASRQPDAGPMLNDRRKVEMDPSPLDQEIRCSMVVSRPKIIIGFKDQEFHADPRRQQAKEIASQMVVEILLGKSSEHYETLYGEGVIDDTFSAYYSGYMDFGFTVLGGDMNDPARFRDRIATILAEAGRRGIDADSFARQKNKYMGKFIRTFNSVESSALSLMNFQFKRLFPHEVLEIIGGISLDDLNERIRTHLDPAGMACSIVDPRKNGVGAKDGAES